MLDAQSAIQEEVANLFPEVEYWLLGFDPVLELSDCNGKLLDSETAIEFLVDHMESSASAVRSASPKAQVVAHYLERPWNPISLGGVDVQPTVFVELLTDEIGQRGDTTSQYFDVMAGDMDAALLQFRREPEPLTNLLGPSPGGSLFSGQGYGSGCFGTVTNPVPGWNEKCREEFQTDASDVRNYAAWEGYPTGAYVPMMPVSGATVALTLTMPQGGASTSATGAYSATSGQGALNFIPNSELNAPPSCQYCERNFWLAHFEFRPGTTPGSSGTHPPVCLRSHPVSSIDFTRFCSFIYAGVRNEGTCSNEPCGAMQFNGRPVSGDPTTTIQKLLSRDAERLIFPSSALYRSQVLEKERFFVWYGWERIWRAEVYDLSVSPADRIFYAGYYSDTQVEWDWGIQVPSLSGSRVTWGFGPGSSGSITVERVATYFWKY